jgi:hypothetical protein
MPLIRLFLDISLFTKGPQDSPASTFLLWLVALGNLVVGIVLSVFDVDWTEALIQSAAGLLLLAGFLGGALYLTGKMPRFLQTATAAFGCDSLISAMAIPLLAWAQLMPEAATVVGILLMLLMLWQIAVIGHILRHALSIPFLAGLGLTLAYTAMSYRIMMALFPPID